MTSGATCISGSSAGGAELARTLSNDHYTARPSDVRGRLEMFELKILEASHPRVAGIVQTHRQQIDAAEICRQRMRKENI
jgi:hypothetical protein